MSFVSVQCSYSDQEDNPPPLLWVRRDLFGRGYTETHYEEDGRRVTSSPEVRRIKASDMKEKKSCFCLLTVIILLKHDGVRLVNL